VVLHLAIFIFAPLICRHTEATNRSTLGGVAQLGIATEISHENDSIEGHEEPFFLSGLLTPRYYKRKTEEASEPKISRDKYLRSQKSAGKHESIAIALGK
jgi:hypothetical protein